MLRRIHKDVHSSGLALRESALPELGVTTREDLLSSTQGHGYNLRRRSTNRIAAQDLSSLERNEKPGHRARASSDLTWYRPVNGNDRREKGRKDSTRALNAKASSKNAVKRKKEDETLNIESEDEQGRNTRFQNPFNTPRELLLRTNLFSGPDNDLGDDHEEISSESSAEGLRQSDDDAVIARLFSIDGSLALRYYNHYTGLKGFEDLNGDLDTYGEESDIGTQVIPKTNHQLKPDFIFTADDYPKIADPKDPARVLRKRDLRTQRLFFFSIVICMNLGALFAAIFAGGTWVFVFILFIKSKDCLSVVVSAIGLLCSSVWRLMVSPKPVTPKWILTLIPAYSESEEQIVKTIFSLRDNDVEPHQQIMCVILDGKHRAVKKHMTRVISSFRRPYVTSKYKLNEFIIDVGFMEDVPVICLEKVKNSGKKDSLIICHDLFNAMRDNAPLYTKLLRKEIWSTILPVLTEGTDFVNFDLVFCTDADSTIHKGAVAALANAIAREKDSIAACGLVLVELEPGYTWSRWNLYQQFQYTFGQYVRRRAEGMYGKVTCLPGCITMIAVRPEMAGAIRKYAEPITAYPVILHQVQYLGTDRRLTYSMLSQDKKLKTLFVPEAVSETVAPQTLQHYLSQRRRWGSNAYFNNYFYCFGEKMIVLTRLAASVELIRLTMIYYRIANTVMFLYGLTKHVEVMKIIPLLVISQLPTIWFAFCVIFVERELRQRAFKLFLGFCINKVISPFLATTVFTKVVKNMGSQVWGMTGGANATASDPAATGQHIPGASPTAIALGEGPRVVLMEKLVEGGLGEQMANLPDEEQEEEERNEKLAGTEEPIPPF